MMYDVIAELTLSLKGGPSYSCLCQYCLTRKTCTFAKGNREQFVDACTISCATFSLVATSALEDISRATAEGYRCNSPSQCSVHLYCHLDKPCSLPSTLSGEANTWQHHHYPHFVLCATQKNAICSLKLYLFVLTKQVIPSPKQ